jgi:hypothetical protein
MAAMAAPLGAWATPQDRDHDRDNNARAEQRHEWSNAETPYYRRWEKENKRKHRDFTKLNDRDKSQYWEWRNAHGDKDKDKDHDRDHDRR